MVQFQKFFSKSLFLLLCLTLLTLLTNKAYSAASIDYRGVAGNRITFAVTISAPPPTSVIVQHFHPAGMQVVSSSPSADKINTQSGTIKWFVKNPQPGSYSFSLQLAKAAPPSTLRLVLRYKDRQSGSLVERTAKP